MRSYVWVILASKHLLILDYASITILLTIIIFPSEMTASSYPRQLHCLVSHFFPMGPSPGGAGPLSYIYRRSYFLSAEVVLTCSFSARLQPSFRTIDLDLWYRPDLLLDDIWTFGTGQMSYLSTFSFTVDVCLQPYCSTIDLNLWYRSDLLLDDIWTFGTGQMSYLSTFSFTVDVCLHTSVAFGTGHIRTLDCASLRSLRTHVN